MSTHFISHKEAGKILFDYPNDGTIFTVTFIKRGDGTLRKMNCRKGVQKGTKGKSLPYDPKQYSLVPVYDMQLAAQLKKQGNTENGAHRMISVEGITEMEIKGTTYIVK
jgi:hypothetical protein